MDRQKYIQHVSAFKRADQLIMTTNVKTKEGLWYLQQPVVALDIRTGLAAIGDALLDTLSRTQTGLPSPPSQAELDETMEQIFKAAGVQTYDHFLEGTLHLSIGRKVGGIELAPTHNGGTDGEGFHFLSEGGMLLEGELSPEQLGDAVLQGFAACTTIYG
jgi:hypothetical protein